MSHVRIVLYVSRWSWLSRIHNQPTASKITLAPARVAVLCRPGHDPSKCSSVADDHICCTGHINRTLTNQTDHANQTEGGCTSGFVEHVSSVPCDLLQHHTAKISKGAMLYTCCANNSVGKCEYLADAESTGMWIPRWGIWHLLLFLVVKHKFKIMPRPLKWVPIMWGVPLAIAMYAGSFRLWGWNALYGGGSVVHIICALFSFIFGWWEAVMLWKQSRILHGAYCFLFVFFITGGGVGTFADVHNLAWLFRSLPEWLVLGLNLIVVWASTPAVERAVCDGTYRPWTGPCCRCCCPYLPARQKGCLCPPTHDDDNGLASIQTPLQPGAAALL
jgi:hypothetical protein